MNEDLSQPWPHPFEPSTASDGAGHIEINPSMLPPTMTPPQTDLDRLNELEAKEPRKISLAEAGKIAHQTLLSAEAKRQECADAEAEHERKASPEIEEIAATSKELAELRQENARLNRVDLASNKLYTTLRKVEIPEADGTGMIDEIRHILLGRENLRSQLTASQESERRMREALESSHMGRAVVHWMRAYDSLKVSDDSDANCQIVRVPKHMIPNGAKLVEAYETERQFIILGHPESDDESHNCDEMGCSTLSHVVARLDKAALTTPVKAEGAVQCDGRTFKSPLDAALHLLWLLQRLSFYEPEREGMPCDGFRFREGIKEARKLLATLDYEKTAFGVEEPATPPAEMIGGVAINTQTGESK